LPFAEGGVDGTLTLPCFISFSAKHKGILQFAEGRLNRQGGGARAAVPSHAHHRTRIRRINEVICRFSGPIRPRKRPLFSRVLPQAVLAAPSCPAMLLRRRPFPVPPMQRHLPGIFRRRMLVLRLIPLAQGPPSESARIPRLPHRPHFWAAAATGAGATRRSAPRTAPDLRGTLLAARAHPGAISVPPSPDFVPCERDVRNLDCLLVLPARRQASPHWRIGAETAHRHLPGIFHGRMLVLRLIPFAQGRPSACARILRLGRRPRF